MIASVRSPLAHGEKRIPPPPAARASAPFCKGGTRRCATLFRSFAAPSIPARASAMTFPPFAKGGQGGFAFRDTGVGNDLLSFTHFHRSPRS
jgi:hypothetical protein